MLILLFNCRSDCQEDVSHRGPIMVDGSFYDVVPVLGCGRCLFRSVAIHGKIQLSSAKRSASGMIEDTSLHAIETQLADRIRLEVVECFEVYWNYYVS